MMKLVNLRRRLIPDYAALQYIICGIGLLVAYYLTRFINFFVRDGIETYTDITCALDGKIPVIPVWTLMYFISYVYWIVAYIGVSRESKELSDRLLFSDILGKFFCTVTYIAFPTTSQRPVGFEDMTCGGLLELLYKIDMQDNLFPSMHCSASWFAMRYVLKCRNIPKYYKALAVIATLAVFASVLFTKQHVILDVVGGVAVAELSIQLNERFKLWKIYAKLDIGKFYERRQKQD